MLNENTIEQSFIDQLIGQGYTYYNGTDISPISGNPQRESFSSVILEQHFKDSLKKLNPTLPESARVEAYQKVINLGTEDIMENNERFHTMLTNGITVEYHKDGRTKGINVQLLDVENPENNNFWVVNQLVVRNVSPSGENGAEKRFDVVIYINGLPLVFVELKSASDEKATLRKAYTQIQNYKKAVPSIFYYNAICVISDGIDATTSSVSAPFSRFLSWRTPSLSNSLKGEPVPSVLNSANKSMYPLLLERAKEMREKPTKAEAILWEELRGKKLGFKFRQQHIIDQYIVDFASIKERVIIEVDGKIHESQKEQDEVRTNVLESLGYSVIRFTNQEVINDINSVKDKIKSFVKSKTDVNRLPLGLGLTDLQILTEYMLNKKTLVELIRYCTVFEQEEKKDEKTGLIFQVKIKKVAAYHQYYAVQKAVVQTLRATTKLPSSNFSQREKKKINYRGNYNFSGLVERAREFRKNQTSVEKTLWQTLRNRQVLNLKFRRQHQIGDYIVDFYCHELKLVIELDGEYHFTEEQQKKDQKRERYLTTIGNKVIRFKNEVVNNNIELILQEIAETKGSSEAMNKSFSPSGRDGSEGYGNRKIGVIWHTQGSGKSLSMVFYSGQIITHPQMENPTIVMLTDRNDLDDQLFGTFGNCVSLLRQKPKQASSREHLKELLNVSGGGVIFTTIQKFAPAEGNVYDTLSERTNIVVVADEAHRSQYGFSGRVVETEDGSEIRYGNAKYLRDALPNASYIGFTGTPIEKEDKSTPAVFGDYIDVYDIKQAVDDGATVPISYESRLIKIKLDEQTAQKLDEEINDISDATEEQIEKAKKKTATIDSVVGHPDRLKDVAKDIVAHFEARQEVFEGKAMIVGMTRNICVRLYNEIVALKPNWHTNDLDKGTIKVIMTSTTDDPELFQPHHTTKQQRKELAIRMKDPNDGLKLVIVRDMWLTGFDAPSLHTMYIDKKMQGANLMQAIARVNRVYKDKPGGLVVDYIGIGQDLRNAMATYIQSGGEGSPVVDIKEAIAGMKEKFEIVEQMFNGFDFKAYFNVETAKKLQVLLGAQNFILSDIKLKERFLKEVTLLSKLFAMSIPSPDADKIKDGIAFFQAVKARINKFTGNTIKSDFEVETAIKQIVDEALSSGGVIDIFEAAGIDKPSVSILSDEFLLEVKNMQQKNVAFELLKKLLSDEVRVRKSKNIAQGKKFSEMLESVVKRYHNNQIDSAQVLAELSEIAKEMRLEDHKSEELGLTPAEYAFYSVLNENESTSFLDDDKMKELIHTIVDVIRKNATVDWSKRDDVRAKLRLTVKKILMRYGYPPDLAKLEADRVLAQGESLAEMFSNESK